MTLRPTIDAAFESGRTQLDLAALARARGDECAALDFLHEARCAFDALGLRSFVERADRLAAGV